MKLIYSGPDPVYVADAHMVIQPGVPVYVHPERVAEILLGLPLWKKAKPDKPTTPEGS